jgi:lipid II:glycine glycyltransferase (peptidoglycan interpeptide bridge formation enzyme)
MSSREEWNKHVYHPLQSFEWGEFRAQTGVKVVREGGLQVTIHRVPHTPWSVGYAPKIITPLNQEIIKTLRKIATENKCIFVKVEPKVEVEETGIRKQEIVKLGFVEGRPLFTRYNFVLDVTPSEAELMASFKQKTRYNIKVAQKRGVSVEVDNSSAAFERYLALTQETTQRQRFYSHSGEYHQKMWGVLNQPTANSQQLTAHLLVARYQNEIITTWILFKFGDTLYYPYGASTREYREVMANNLVMWEAIRLAKAWGLKYLDMWGALGPEPDTKDPWYGFHTFKLGYGPRHVEYIGTWDYVTKPLLYRVYRLTETLRWWILRMRAK